MSTDERRLIVYRPVLVGALALLTPQASYSNPAGADKGVTVVNTSSNPVPVAAQGTTNIAGNVSVTNTPTVQAQQGGTWTVGVNSWESNPVFVRHAGESARQPVQVAGFVNIDNGTFGTANPLILYTVPDGKRLVIEWASVGANVPAGQRITSFTFSTTAGNTGQGHRLVVYDQGTTFNCSAHFTASQQVRFYADPGTQVKGFATPQR